MYAQRQAKGYAAVIYAKRTVFPIIDNNLSIKGNV